ncbi:hypothetical protein [Arthrobacter sp. Y81]|uniref:hypothetical protein n=1 Tax=Arthrobacter sp. Y81 TaxID=2058897 RepID=UPI0015E2CEA7|nr:hypothetical protein [Arthrobacter sp. Y81]
MPRLSETGPSPTVIPLNTAMITLAALASWTRKPALTHRAGVVLYPLIIWLRQ